jgi:hypothetical protein
VRLPRDGARFELDGAPPAGECEGRRAILLARSGPASPLLRESTGIPDRVLGPSSHKQRSPARRGGGTEPDTVTFALLTFLLVLAVVAVLFAIFYLVRRWL